MIPTKQAHLHPAAITHPGMSGKNNEDQYAISAYTLAEDNPTPVVLAIVADGIGGHNAGEIASEIAVNVISEVIAASDGSEPLHTLVKSAEQASICIHEQSETETSRQGMGSTCVSALVISEQLYITSVGDSRIYLLRGGKIQRLTTDHTWVQEAIDHGVLSQEEARDHPRRHIIHRYLGSSKPIEVDTRLRLDAGESDQEAEANQGTRLFPGDQVLLCCDGLTDLVTDEEILSITQEIPDQEKALEKLVNLANERGGHDNITIISLRVPKEEEIKEKEPEAKPLSKTALWFYIVCAVVIVTINILGYLIWKGWLGN